jgi:hypothetical protein
MVIHPEGIDDIGDCFFDIEETITDIFQPALYGESLKDCNYHRTVFQHSL